MDLFGFFVIALLLLFLVVVLVVVGILVNKGSGKTSPAPVVEQKPVQVEVKPVEKPIVEIPAGMKECFQCKSIIRGDVITCPHCGKSPERSTVVWQSISHLGNVLLLLGLCILVPFILAMCGYLGSF